MAYNKAKEEKKWRLWKEAEENKLRSLGVDEDTISKFMQMIIFWRKGSMRE